MEQANLTATASTSSDSDTVSPTLDNSTKTTVFEVAVSTSPHSFGTDHPQPVAPHTRQATPPPQAFRTAGTTGSLRGRAVQASVATLPPRITRSHSLGSQHVAVSEQDRYGAQSFHGGGAALYSSTYVTASRTHLFVWFTCGSRHLQVLAVITDNLYMDFPPKRFFRVTFSKCRLLLLHCVARVELAPAHELRNVIVPESPRAVLHCIIMRFFAAVAIVFSELPTSRACIETKV
jgi:hypothetical protein